MLLIIYLSKVTKMTMKKAQLTIGVVGVTVASMALAACGTTTDAVAPPPASSATAPPSAFPAPDVADRSEMPAPGQSGFVDTAPGETFIPTGTMRCGNAPGGQICIDFTPDGYQALYAVAGDTGHARVLDFHLDCNRPKPVWVGDAGYFTVPKTSKGHWSYVFKTGHGITDCHVVMYMPHEKDVSWHSPAI